MAIIPSEVRKGLEAFAQSEQFVSEQDGRPLADKCYLQELAEQDDKADGRYLVQVLGRLGDELQGLLIRGVNRELAMVLAKVQEAEGWAIAHGRKTNSHVLIDRRIFKVPSREDPANETS